MLTTRIDPTDMETRLTNILDDLSKGKLTPKEAVEKPLISSAVHISNIKVSDLKIETYNTGFKSLDTKYHAFKKDRGELIILGARPSMGKSSILFQIAKNIAAVDNVLIFSLEMDKESIVTRLLAEESGRFLSRMYKGEVEFADIKNAHAVLCSLNMYIDDRSGLDVRTIRNASNEFSQRHQLSLVVVDYLQLIKTRDRQSRNEEIGDITAELKALAKDLKCPVLVASQLNRQCEVRGKDTGDYKPIMSDLRDSGNIEQDADLILFLSRQSVYDNTRQGEADLVVAKNRNGMTGEEVLIFNGEHCSFTERNSI